jgi:peptidoglycan/LPS O-acetylase OafA/YrhL
VSAASIQTRTAATEYLAFIDGLRAIAVFGVVGFHANLGGLTGGYVGVDVFFVLSGFLISRLIESRLQERTFSFAQFYERRARRILPALSLTCLFCVLVATFLFVPRDLREFSSSLWGTAFFYSNVLFEEATGYFSAPSSSMPLLHAWSLSVEEQFYLFFPPLLFALHWLLRKWPRARWTVMLLALVASLGASILLMRFDASRAFYLLPPRAWELFAGALIALEPQRPVLSRLEAEIVTLLGAACIALSFFWYTPSTPFPGAAALLPCLGTAAIIVANIDNRTSLGRLLSQRLLVYLGLISYGLYLYHWPLLTFTRYFLDRELSTLQSAAVVSAAIALAVVSFHGIEIPIRRGLFFRTRAHLFAASAAALLGLGLMGIIGVNMHGFPSRFSGAALQFAQAEHDRQPWDQCMPPVTRLSADTACRVGLPEGKPTFLVWGDSHAAALAPGIDERAKTLGLSGWVIGYSRCPSLIGAAPIRHAAGDFACADIAERVMGMVHDHHIRHVLLASRWDTYISGWERGGVETHQDLTVAYAEGGVLYKGEAAVRLSLQETVRRLQASDVEVWVLEQVPPQLVDVPSALAKAVYLHRDPELLRRPYAEIESRRAPAEAIFTELRRLGDVSFIDPAEKFCPDRGSCLIAVQGHSLYQDNNHLTVFGAKWSRDMLDPFFSATIQ